MIIPIAKDFSFHILIVAVTGLLLVYGYSVTTGVGINIYKCYANVFLHGADFTLAHAETEKDSECILNNKSAKRLHTQLPAEYPLLALVPILLPMVGGDSLYDAIFIALMLSVIVGIYFYLLSVSSKGAAVVYIVYILIGGFGIAIGRLDIIVGALILLSLHAANSKNYSRAYIFLALATMLKLVPVILVLPLFLAEQKDLQQKKSVKRWYGICTFFSLCILVFIVSLGIDFQGSFAPFTYGLLRPIQIESIPATIMSLLESLNIITICYGLGFGSLNIYGFQAGVCNPSDYALYGLISQTIIVSGLLLFILVFLYLGRLFLLQKLTLSQFYLAVLLMFLCTNKVFSPQYLFWIYPLIAYIYGFDKRWLIGTALLAFLTTLIYPFISGLTTLLPFYGHTILLNVISIRNMLIVSVTIFYIFNIFNLRLQKRINFQ